MTNYVAFLRGVNVGGKNKLKMSEFSQSLVSAGFTDVKTYIQSGNVIFTSAEEDTGVLGRSIAAVIKSVHKIDCEVVVFSKAQWQKIIAAAPDWWGNDQLWKHNILILIPPFLMDKVVTQIGVLIPTIEAIKPGKGVLYQSMSKELFGRTTTGKLAGSPVYKKMTIRNYNTANKILSLLNQ